MLTTITIGVLSSIATEVVTWLNKKLSGTVLRDKAAFLLAACIALIGASFQVLHNGIPFTDWTTLGTTFTQVWTIAQIFFVLIVKTLKLDVQSYE